MPEPKGRPRDADEHRDAPGQRTWTLGAALLIGLMFGLPHLVRIAVLGSYAAYSPFTAHSPSAMVYDETFLYGAEANYMLTRGGAPAYDDTWEHRATVYPYSLVPTAMEALGAALLRSLKAAHILGSFLFPLLTALVLMAVFRRAGAEVGLAALLALTVLAVAFSPLTLLMDVRAFLQPGRGLHVVDTLQAARTPNPCITFLEFAACVLLMANALRRGQTLRAALGWAAAAGALGGLLYFSYIYYAIAWTAAVALLALAALLMRRVVPLTVWAALPPMALFAALFLWWEHIAKTQGHYDQRAFRIGLYHGHTMVPGAWGETDLWGGLALVSTLVWLWLRRRAGERRESTRLQSVDALMLILLAAMAGGLAGMNMQLVTGFNVQQVQHYPHMVLQPVGFMLVGLLVALAWGRSRAWKAASVVGFGLLLTLCVMAQVQAGRDSAAWHELPVAERQLVAWLNTQTPVGSVVATDDLALSLVLPVETHNSLLFADGSRSSADDHELMERFLLASRLEGDSSETVASRLAGEFIPEANDNYPHYMFEFSDTYQRFRAERRVAPERIPALLVWYASIDPARELERFRVDYVWTASGRLPTAVPGWRYTTVFASGEGTLWRLERG